MIQSTTSLVVTNVIASNSISEVYAQKFDNCSNSNSSNVIYNASSSIPSESTLQSQASAASFLLVIQVLY